MAPGVLAGDPLAFTRGQAILPSIDSASLSVMRGRPSSNRVSQPASDSLGGLAPDAKGDVDAGVAETLDPLACGARVGILERDHDPAGRASTSRSTQAGPREL